MHCPHCDMQLIPVQGPLGSQLHACPGCGEVSEAEPAEAVGFSLEELEDTIMAYGVASYRTNISAVGDRLDTLAHEFRAELKRRRGNTP